LRGGDNWIILRGGGGGQRDFFSKKIIDFWGFNNWIRGK